MECYFDGKYYSGRMYDLPDRVLGAVAEALKAQGDRLPDYFDEVE